MPGQESRSALKNRRKTQQSPSHESDRQKLVSAGFLFAPLLPKGARNKEEQQSNTQFQGYVYPFARIAQGPDCRGRTEPCYTAPGDREARVHSRRTIE